MKKTLAICIILQFTMSLFGRELNVDSLINVLNTQELSVTDQLQLYRKISGYYANKDADKGLLYGYQGLRLAEKAKDKTAIAAICTHIGGSLLLKSSPDSSFIYLDRAIGLSQEMKDKELEASATNNMGNLQILLNNNDKALAYYLKALALYESINDKKGATRLLINISSLYDNLSQYDRAMHYLVRAQTYLETINDPQLETAVYQLIGGYYLRTEDYKKALENMLIAFDLSHKYNLIRYQVITAQFLAGIYSDGFENYEKAEEYALKCVEAAESTHSTDMLITAWNILTKIYIETGKYKQAERIALKVWDKDSTRVIGAANTANCLVVCYLQLNENEKALHFFNKYKAFQDEIAEKELLNSISDMEVKYQTEKKEIRIASLEKEKQFYIWLTIAAVITLFMFMGVLFYRHRLNVQKRKTAEKEKEIAQQQIQQLEKEKQLIATQAVLEGETAERSRLARDLHDGLGGMLSVVKMNLEKAHHLPKADKLKANHYHKAMELLDESVEELRRVAHHIMPESLMQYGLKVSLHDFCRAIPNAHFQFIGEEARLDNSLEVMLYRCAYELINNAVKYANASHINVQLVFDKSVIALSVDDDGTGFDPNKPVPGTGLNNIRTRVLAYNGKITIRSVPGQGTEVIIEIESA